MFSFMVDMSWFIIATLVKFYHLNTTHTRFVSLFGRETFYFKYFANKVEESFVYLINKYEFIIHVRVCEIQELKTENEAL